MNKTISYIYVILSAVCWGFIGFSNRLLTEVGMTLGNRVFVRNFGTLLLFAVLSELPFNLMCSGQWLSWNYQNVLWTLLIGALVCWAMDWARTRPEMWQRLPADAAIAVGFLLGQVCNTDYGGWGVLLVTLFYLTREVRNRWAIQLVGLALFCWFCSAWRLEMLAMLSLIPLCLYNGERGFSNKALQYGFYAFYPVHILILSVLARYVF